MKVKAVISGGLQCFAEIMEEWKRGKKPHSPPRLPKHHEPR